MVYVWCLELKIMVFKRIFLIFVGLWYSLKMRLSHFRTLIDQYNSLKDKTIPITYRRHTFLSSITFIFTLDLFLKGFSQKRKIGMHEFQLFLYCNSIAVTSSRIKKSVFQSTIFNLSSLNEREMMYTVQKVLSRNIHIFGYFYS